MYQLHPDNRTLTCRQTGKNNAGLPASRHALTLVELMIGMSLLSMLAVVLSGLVSAVSSSRNYTAGLEEANAQSQAVLERMKYMTSHVGVYQYSGQPTVPGLAVITHDHNGETVPDTLVVWSGGRSGGMAEMGILNRLPTIEELVIYTPNPSNAAELVEITVPGNTNAIDFLNAGFADSIRTLITDVAAEQFVLMDRLRVVNLAAGGAANTGCLWLEMVQTPTDSEIATATVGTSSWTDLPWVQGIASSNNGLRQVTINIELQTNTDFHNNSDQTQPCFGAWNYRYVYQP